MSFNIYLSKPYYALIYEITGKSVKKFNVPTLDINNGLLRKNNYYIPVEHILFIEEV